MTWWNTAYLNRREIVVTSASSVQSGSLVQLDVNIDQLVTNGVVRSDYEDIELISISNAATPSYTVLGRDVTSSAISFEIDQDISTGNKYYIYYNNPLLTSAPTRPTYTLNLYPLSVAYNGTGVSYTRPQEHWIDGVSTTRNARASFKFYGANLSIIFESGPQGGLATIQVDGDQEVTIDTYAATTSNTSLYNTTALSLLEHEVKVRVIGEHTQTSTASIIKLISFDTSGDIVSSYLAEEVNMPAWTSYIGGV